MFDFVQRWLIGRHPVRRATTEAEKEAVYRLRYQVYVEELGKHVGHADHDRRRLVDPEDALPGAVSFYVGTPERMLGTLRQVVWAPGGVPPAIADRYTLDRFPGAERLPVSELTRCVITREARGGPLLLALVAAAYRHAAAHGVALSFAYCTAGLMRAYGRLGNRPYGAPLVETPDGVRIPIVLVPSDVEHLRLIRSPLAAEAAARRRAGELPALDLAPWSEVLAPRTSPVAHAPREVHACVVRALGPDGAASPLLEGLARHEVRELARHGFVVRVPAGSTLTARGVRDRELAVVLDGAFTATDAAGEARLLGRGDAFGGAAMFVPSARQDVSVRATTAGAVLLMRWAFLYDLMASRPRLASKLLYNLARIFAARAAEPAGTDRATLGSPPIVPVASS